MKKQSHIITNNGGFYLPYVLTISVIVLSLVTTSIMMYQNEMKMTKNIIEQVEVETLIQMAREKFKHDKVYNEHSTGQINYVFPNGVVHIQYEFMNEETLQLHFFTETKNNYQFDIVHEITISNW